MNKIVRSFIVLTLAVVSPIAFTADFLPPEQAFMLKTEHNNDQIKASWQIEAGYYLYQDRIHAYLDSNVEQAVPVIFTTNSVIKNDKNFGEVPVFYEQAEAIVQLSGLTSSKPEEKIFLEYQGCAKSGLCYQPQTIELAITPLQSGKAFAAKSPAPEPQPASNPDTIAETPLSSISDITDFLKTSGFWTTIGVFFLLGAGLSLTPCILPMVPILTGIIVGHGKQLTAVRGFSLSGSYVLGMSVTYAIVGVLVATLGAKGNLQIHMQNPWAISIFAAVFVLLALSMFGLYTLQLPPGWQNRLNNLSTHQHGGQYSGVFIMGALAAMVASPCVSAPLAGALVYISSTGDTLLGASALFFLGLGMGLPLLALGAGGGKLIPKAGVWMNQVKVFFGVVLLGVSIWLLSRIISGQMALLLWALLLIFYGIYTGALDAAEPGIARIRKAASFSILFYGCVLLLGAVTEGAVTGSVSPLAPITINHVVQSNNKIDSAVVFQRINSRSELTEALSKANAENKPVMLDFYADWCTACIDMEHQVFSNTDVQNSLASFQLLQIDITDNTAEHRELMDQFGLYGPPSIVFFSQRSKEMVKSRIQGELDSPSFIRHLEKVKILAQQCPHNAADYCS